MAKSYAVGECTENLLKRQPGKCDQLCRSRHRKVPFGDFRDVQNGILAGSSPIASVSESDGSGWPKIVPRSASGTVFFGLIPNCHPLQLYSIVKTGSPNADGGRRSQAHGY